MEINKKQIYSYCLDGNLAPALEMLSSYNNSELNAEDLKFKTDFENRFGSEEDKSDYLNNRDEQLHELLKLYLDYWRISLISVYSENHLEFEKNLKNNLSGFLTSQLNLDPEIINLNSDDVADSVDVYLKKYLNTNGYLTTGFGKTGKFYDLLVWKTSNDTDYSFTLQDEETKVKVVFMEDFVTLGWEEYATFGKLYPGGWATKEALFCVKSAYDIESENFKISYLAHESRHFADYRLFPKLKSADLEYRAKLTELSLLNETLYKIIDFFIINSNYDSDNGHSVANYCVIRDMSEKLFKKNFESDIDKWKEISVNKINETAYELLKQNTSELEKSGKEVESFIK